MNIKRTIKPATPWNVSLAKLTSLEKTILASEGEALKARWTFGRELVSRRVDYKGRLVIPRDLMTLTTEKCGLSTIEVNRRVQFATRYPTRDLMSHAMRDYPSWYQMTRDGLVEKKRAPKKRGPVLARAFVLRRVMKDLDTAYAHHADLSRDDVQTIEHLVAQLQKILDQVDRNDKAKAS
jgi:hypothetical protein